MSDRRTQLDALAVGLLLMLCASWGLQQATIKIVNPGISPVLQAGLRSLVATLIIWGWAAWRGQGIFVRDGSLWPGLATGAMFAIEFALLYWGLLYTPASRGILFLYTAPFVVSIGAHFFIPGERMRRVQAIGLLCAFAGIVFAFKEGLELPTSSRELLGDAMELAAAMLWGATTVLIKASRLGSVKPVKVLFYQLATSGVTLPFLSLALGEAGITRITPVILLCLAYQALFVASVTYVLWFWLIAHYPASKLSAFSFLTPLFGMIAGALLLAEPVTSALVVAMVLVAIGIYLVNRPAAQAVAP